MVKLNYWERRQIENMYEYMQSAENISDQIASLYLKAARYLSLEADQIFQKYKIKYNLSDQEAMRLLNELNDKTSLDELIIKLKNSKNIYERKRLLEQLEAPAYQARLERMRQLINQLDIVMDNIYKQEKVTSTSYYVDLANEAYYKSMFNVQQMADAAFAFNHVDAKAIDRIINSKWSGKNYSKRIWGNTKSLSQIVKEELLLSFVTGRTNRETAEIISNKFAKGASNARRLVRTESNYLATELNFKVYEETGIERYLYLATLDLKTSELCRELDGKVFLVKDRVIGKNCPPMHPWCRSTTIAVIEEEWLKDMQRVAVNPETGERIKVPLTMNYEQWYKKYVTGNPKTEIEKKKIKNRSSDRTQHEKYKKILGKDLPDILDDFQDMKYNEIEKWAEIKEAYKDVNWQRKALEKHSSGEVHSVPGKAEPNSVFDKYENGKLIQRRYYGKTGKPRLDIDMTDHHNPKEHQVVPHRHGWKELESGGIQREDVHDIPLRLGDKIANADILKGET